MQRFTHAGRAQPAGAEAADVGFAVQDCVFVGAEDGEEGALGWLGVLVPLGVLVVRCAIVGVGGGLVVRWGVGGEGGVPEGVGLVRRVSY